MRKAPYYPLAISTNDRIHPIDSLRGLAVIWVVLNHMGFKLFEIGYLGVDIFFLISGFVITHLLSNEFAHEKKINFKKFYISRFFRLFPAYITVISLTIFLSILLFPPRINFDIAKSTISSLFHIANIHFLFDVDYFGTLILEKPLLHLWSLSVEEQFYLFFPVFISVSYCKSNNHIRNTVGIIILSILFTIFTNIFFNKNTTISVAEQTFTAEQLKFYFTPYRMYEFFLGSLAYQLKCKYLFCYTPKLQSHTSYIFFIILAIPFLFHPGYFNSIYVTYILLFLIFLYLLVADNCSYKNNLILGIFNYLGLISYSIYLVHWPIIVICRKIFDKSFYANYLILSFIIIGGLSINLLVEKPFKNPNSNILKYCRSKILVSLVLFCFSISLYIILNKGFMPFNYKITNNSNYLQYENKSTLVDNSTLIIGESHSTHFVPLYSKLNINPRLKVKNISGSGCLPIPGMEIFKINKNTVTPIKSHCKKFHHQVNELIHNNKPKLVVIAARWSHYLYDEEYVLAPSNMDQKNIFLQVKSHSRQVFFKETLLYLDKFINDLSTSKIPLVIMGEVPILGIHLVDCLTSPKLIYNQECVPNFSREDIFKRTDLFDKSFEKIANSYGNVWYIPTHKILCPADRENCLTKLQGEHLYKDDNHLSPGGSAKLSELFDEYLEVNSIDFFK